MTETKKLDFEDVAWEVFRMHGVWRRLLAEHVPADVGDRCKGCWEDQGAGHIWPCTLHAIATRAGELHEEWMALIREEKEPTGVCHGCGGPAYGLICGSCERSEREARKRKRKRKKESDG